MGLALGGLWLVLARKPRQKLADEKTPEQHEDRPRPAFTPQLEARAEHLPEARASGHGRVLEGVLHSSKRVADGDGRWTYRAADRTRAKDHGIELRPER